MMKRFFQILICLAAMATPSAGNALTLAQAKKLYTEGRFSEALSTFQEYQKKSPANANYNQWVGACLYETGRKAESKKYFEAAYSKKVADAARYLAQLAFEEMDYTSMEQYIEQFEELIGNDESELSETATKGYHRLQKISAMLNNVEKIQIFDSLVVDKKDFFRHYKLSDEAGTLNGPDVLARPETADSSTVVFMPQSKSRMVWAMPDSTGTVRITESYRLADGNWDKPSMLSADLNEGGDAAYPFFMPDGTTIYFASTGENSIGGYDIFMSRKDFATGNYPQPQNVGFPYNSPYNDYMLAIDEMNGVGWWATDRRQPSDKIAIYVFKRNEIRENYDPSSYDVCAMAEVRAISDTWEDDNNYAELRATIENATSAADAPEDAFFFFVTNGVSYTQFDQFKSQEARSMMQKRLSLASKVESSNAKMRKLRATYAKASQTEKSRLSSEILQLENQILDETAELSAIDNTIRSLEIQLLD